MNTVKVRNIEIGAGIPKICVPIVGVTREEILAAAETIKSTKADVVEWRVDWYEDIFDFAKTEETMKALREVLGETPILFTFRTSKEGGEKSIETETYVEFAPDINEITAVSLTREFTNLMILRGVSKFYAAPGMRLGYGITGNLEFLKKMKEKQVPWSLNSLGALAGELMLQDKTYIRQTRDLILSERTRLLKALELSLIHI